MEMTTKGIVSATATQKRRRMSRSSAFSSSPAVTVRGSNAMPHLGQLPGESCTTSGCMGQVHSVLRQRDRPEQQVLKPCRTWGSRPAQPVEFPGPWGRYKSPPADASTFSSALGDSSYFSDIWRNMAHSGAPGYGHFYFGVHGTGQIGLWGPLALCSGRSLSFSGFSSLCSRYRSGWF